MNRIPIDRLIRFVAVTIAGALLLIAMQQPLWTMRLNAPQYPKGLHLKAYGERLEGDIREINILNQYIGMANLSERPAPEMALFPWSIGALVLLLIVAPFNRILYGLATLGVAALPFGILGDMQIWLYKYGHNLDSSAPLRQKPFTPHVIGNSAVGQFSTTAELAAGIELMLIAAVILSAGYFIGRGLRRRGSSIEAKQLPLAATLMLCFAFSAGIEAATLQQQIDATPAAGTLEVPAGTYTERLVIRKPITLLGNGQPVIDGGGRDSVITIDADHVHLRGFTIRNSGRTTIEEAAGIDVRGSHHRIEFNVIRDVHFGIHATEGASNVIANNTIIPGRGKGYRAGDGINVWYLTNSSILHNKVSSARDGIYLSFTDGLTVTGNEVSNSRYGLHSMFSQNAVVERNHLRENLLGAALMNSNKLTFRGNRVERNRSGATAYGLLLKDIGDLLVEDNLISQNRVGIYADMAPDRADRNAIIRRNVIAGNETAFALQSNVRLIVTENNIVENLTEVRAEGGGLSKRNEWSSNGIGNYWSGYRGVDRDRDGIGEQPFRVSGAIDHLLQKNAMIRAFLYTPAHSALETAARMFPLFAAEPLVVDPAPLMQPRRLARIPRTEKNS